jgi:cytochrome P450
VAAVVELVTGEERDALRYSEALGSWVVQRHDDSVAVLRNEALEIPRLPLPSGVGTEREREALAPLWEQAGHVPLYSGGRAHHRLRRGLHGPFTQDAVRARRPAIRAAAEELVAAQVPAGQSELVGDVAEPLLRRVMADVVGIPGWAEPDFDRWVTATVRAGSLGTPAWSEDILAEAVEAVGAIDGLVRSLLARPGELAPGSVLAFAAGGQGGGEPLTDHEIVVNSRALYTAGVHTTAPLIAASACFLFGDEDVLAEARRDERVVAAVVQETLRFASPAVETNLRQATRDVTIAGKTIRREQFVRTVILQANRDPRRYDHPDDFDHRRLRQGKALGFGTGPHVCLGNHLATAIAEETCAALVAPALDARMGEPRPEFRRRPSIPVMWGPTAIHLKFGPERRSDGAPRRTTPRS